MPRIIQLPRRQSLTLGSLALEHIAGETDDAELAREFWAASATLKAEAAAIPVKNPPRGPVLRTKKQRFKIIQERLL